MHEILNSFKQQPIPKFQQKLNDIEKPKKFSKTPNPRFQNMKCMNMRYSKLTKWRKTCKSLKKPWRISLEWVSEVWVVKRRVYQERDREKWETGRAEPL